MATTSKADDFLEKAQTGKMNVKARWICVFAFVLCILLSFLRCPVQENELRVVEHMQLYPSMDHFMEFVTRSGDPKLALHVWGPLVLWLDFFYPDNRNTGLLSVMAVLLADLANAALKWPFGGDRPYWVGLERVRQFAITCESGFGNPSGHCMATAAFWVAFSPRIADLIGTPLTACFLSIYLVLVGLSRVHVGAHFPSQAMAGILCGIVVARSVWLMSPRLRHRFLYNRGWSQYGRLLWSVISLLLLLGFEVWALGPSWLAWPIHRSVALAHQACIGPVHLSTSPLLCVTRILGIWLGGGLGLTASTSAFRHLHTPWTSRQGSPGKPYTPPEKAKQREGFLNGLITQLNLASAGTPRRGEAHSNTKAVVLCVLGLLFSSLIPAVVPLPGLPPASPPDPSAVGTLASAGLTAELLLLAFLHAGVGGLVVAGWPAAATWAGLV
eukprot:gb/GEZN01008593.1/.p1 GENE.gb/GEZN01008593.1/~~gb/GEZN01008593.1/.p1  ORF type:complete len:459 (-),score=35.91 gb/GEZN01008593.1/:34-1359(-)